MTNIAIELKQRELLEIRKLTLKIPGQVHEVAKPILDRLIANKVRYDLIAEMLVDAYTKAAKDTGSPEKWERLHAMMLALSKHHQEAAVGVVEENPAAPVAEAPAARIIES